MKKIRMGVIGYGQRGSSLTRDVLCRMEDVEIAAVCDLYPDRVEEAVRDVQKRCGNTPFGTVDPQAFLHTEGLDAVFVATSWESHIEIAIEALRLGIATALEVGGAYNHESLWELVHEQERTQTPFMLMENCCFGKTELFATALARSGRLGDVVHCHGCYGHYLCEEIAGGNKNRHYRLRNYLARNGENYPTHELGPIAKLLNINRGNRMVSLVSVASRSAGMEAYIQAHAEEYPDLLGKTFRQGDIVNTIITCADGSTISLRLDTTLPRYYSREFTVRGTKGMYEQNTHMVYFTGDEEGFDSLKIHRKHLGNAEELEEAFLPPVWKNITPEEIQAGHGGMDGIEFRVFVDCLKEGRTMPIDVYDAAAWMCITALSEQSVALGGAPQVIPDFTGGNWLLREPMDVIELS